MGSYLAAIGTSSGTAAAGSSAAAATTASTAATTAATTTATTTASTAGQSSLMSSLSGWASIGSAIMSGISGYREGRIKEKQLQAQATQSELQATQESNRIRENLLESMATARTQFGKAGAGGLTPMAIQEKSARLANEDINNINFMNQIQQGQYKIGRLSARDESAMSLIKGGIGAITSYNNMQTTKDYINATNKLNNIRRVK